MQTWLRPQSFNPDLHQRQHRSSTCGCTVIYFHSSIFVHSFFLPNLLKSSIPDAANIKQISPLHTKHFNKNTHEFNFVCFLASRGWEQRQMRTYFRSSVFCMHLRKVPSTSKHSMDPVLWKYSCGTWAGSDRHITIHRLISYQVNSTDYLPFQYRTSTLWSILLLFCCLWAH